MSGSLDRVDLPKLKARVLAHLGKMQGALYWDAVKRYVTARLSRSEYESMVASLLGENIHLHNDLVRGILLNARSKSVPDRVMAFLPQVTSKKKPKQRKSPTKKPKKRPTPRAGDRRQNRLNRKKPHPHLLSSSAAAAAEVPLDDLRVYPDEPSHPQTFVLPDSVPLAPSASVVATEKAKDVAALQLPRIGPPPLDVQRRASASGSASGGVSASGSKPRTLEKRHMVHTLPNTYRAPMPGSDAPPPRSHMHMPMRPILYHRRTFTPPPRPLAFLPDFAVLRHRMMRTAQENGITQVSDRAVLFVMHALESHLKNIVEKSAQVRVARARPGSRVSAGTRSQVVDEMRSPTLRPPRMPVAGAGKDGAEGGADGADGAENGEKKEEEKEKEKETKEKDDGNGEEDTGDDDAMDVSGDKKEEEEKEEGEEDGAPEEEEEEEAATTTTTRRKRKRGVESAAEAEDSDDMPIGRSTRKRARGNKSGDDEGRRSTRRGRRRTGDDDRDDGDDTADAEGADADKATGKAKGKAKAATGKAEGEDTAAVLDVPDALEDKGKGKDKGKGEPKEANGAAAPSVGAGGRPNMLKVDVSASGELSAYTRSQQTPLHSRLTGHRMTITPSGLSLRQQTAFGSLPQTSPAVGAHAVSHTPAYGNGSHGGGPRDEIEWEDMVSPRDLMTMMQTAAFVMGEDRVMNEERLVLMDSGLW